MKASPYSSRPPFGIAYGQFIDITPIVGSDLGLMIRAFSAALEDDDLLVRRGALDILLQSLRIDGVAVQKAQADDRAILMRAATSVVLRRDLALNRRLFAWLLGPGEGSQVQIEYYKQHSLELLRSTLRVMPSGFRSPHVLIHHVAGRDVQPITRVLSISPVQDLHLAVGQV